MSAQARSRYDLSDISPESEIITMPERLDSVTAPIFEKTIIDHIASGAHDLVLDCCHIRFLTAAGLRMILSALRATRAVDGQMVLCNLHGQARAMFDACGFDHFIPVHDGVMDVTASRSVA